MEDLAVVAFRHENSRQLPFGRASIVSECRRFPRSESAKPKRPLDLQPNLWRGLSSQKCRTCSSTRLSAPWHSSVALSFSSRAIQQHYKHLHLASNDMQVSCTGRSAWTAQFPSAQQCRHHPAPPLAPCRLRTSSIQTSDSHRACWRAQAVPQRTRQRHIRATYPEPETEKERSPLDYPQVRYQHMHKLSYLKCMY